jgi:hypothetical protein
MTSPLTPVEAETVRHGWQPIETAPRDGSFFDVTWAGETHRYLPVPYRMTDCYWDERMGGVVRKHGYPASTTWFSPQPTHWMPLPDAPESSS